MRVLIPVAFAIATSACLFDGAVPAGAAIACRDDAECPSGQVCSALLGGQCAPAVTGDNAAPTATVLVEPAAAAVGTRVEVRVQASEALGADPVASIDLGAIRRPLVLTSGRATAGDLAFVFVYEPLGDEPQGPRAIVVDVVDRLGTTGQALASLALDFQAPRLAGPPTVLTPTTNREVRVAVAFVDDSDVAEATVTMTPTAGGEAVGLEADAAAPGIYARAVDGVADGTWRVEVAAHDAVGNAMATVDAGIVVVDRSAPLATTATVSPSAVRRGDLVRLTLQATETLADDANAADIAALVQITPALSAEVIATVGAGNLREVVLRVGDDANDGDYAVTMGPLRDAAGNVTAAVALGSVRVDGTAPQVTQVAVDGDPLNSEGALEVTVVLDEAVVEAPLVQLGAAAMRPVPRVDGDQPHIWIYRLGGQDVALEDFAEVIVIDATDSLGNRAQALRTGTVVEVDTIRPRVVATVTSADGEAVQDTMVFVFTVFSEPVIQPPELRWNGPTLDFLPTASAPGRAFTYVAPVRFDSPDGDARLEGVGGTTDLAGNPVVTDVEPVVVASRPRRCLPGRHFGERPSSEGRAVCVDDNTCLVGNHFGGEVSPDPTLGRVCLGDDFCSDGFRFGGARLDAPIGRECLPVGTCSFGSQIGEDPSVCLQRGNCTCVASATCSVGHHSGGAPNESRPVLNPSTGTFATIEFSTCVSTRSCAPGFHDDDGRLLNDEADCVPIDECASGSQIGQVFPDCIANNTCTCVPRGTCATGYHPGVTVPNGGEAICVPDNLCLEDARNDGHGDCIARDASCARGFHEGGAGFCMPRGRCTPGHTDDGTGECRSVDAPCTEGYRDDGTGLCRPETEPCAPGFRDDGRGFADKRAGLCVALRDACPDDALRDGGDGDCRPKGECAPGFVQSADSCVPVLACDAGQHDGGDGKTCVELDTCAAGFTLSGSFCRPASPVLLPGVFTNACDPETTGRVGSDERPLQLAVDAARLPAVGGVRLECRVETPAALHLVPFETCEGALADLANREPGLLRLEVRTVLERGDGEVISRSAMHTFTVHESLDGVQCCQAPVSDEQWFSAARDLLATAETPTFSPLSTAQKPYVFADGGEVRFNTISLRHRFALSEDQKLLLVTRSAASSFAERESGSTATCSGVRLRLGESGNGRCPNDDEWRLPIRDGLKGFRTARFTCTEVEDGCRRFRYLLDGRVLFEREDCVDARTPYQLFEAEVQQCEAYVVNAAGEALCLAHDVDGVRIVDSVEGAGADLGLRILNNRGRHRAFSTFNKQGL